MVFYEAPHKLLATLQDLEGVLGDRKVIIARELTKLYEEIETTTLSAAAIKYGQKTPKGEFVLVLAGRAKEREEDSLTDAQVGKSCKSFWRPD
jgi:16S rRNA (cytidine1402-2'-O)-methyltransferase